MPSKSKTKGNKFELDMCKHLNKCYDTTEFARVPSSGAIMGQSNWTKNIGLSEEVKRTLSSDLITPDDFPFSIECKHYIDSPNYATIIKSDDTDLDRWLGETIFDAININLLPLLFFKTNRKGVHAALHHSFLQIVDIDHYLRYGQFIIIGLEHFTEYCIAIQKFASTWQDPILEQIKESDHTKILLEKLEETVKKKKKVKTSK